MLKAILIGINYEGTSSKLNGCVNDAMNMLRFLQSETDNNLEYRLLTDAVSDSEASKLTFAKPTKKHIIEAMTWLRENETSDSCMFVHYSGHGGSVRDRDGDEKDGKDETIYALDGHITDDELRKYLVQGLPNKCRLTALFDSCHSGTVLDLRYVYNVSKNKTHTRYTIDMDRTYPISKAKVVLLSGCRDSGFSADSWADGQAQGAMTHSFLKTWKRCKRKGQRITYQQLFSGLLKFISNYKQKPQLSSGSMIDLTKKFRLV